MLYTADGPLVIEFKGHDGQAGRLQFYAPRHVRILRCEHVVPQDSATASTDRGNATSK